MSSTQAEQAGDGSANTAGAAEPAFAASSTPVTAGRRLANLDFIRGFAVLGILTANIVAFAQPINAYMWPDAFLTEHGPVSDWMWVGQLVLVDGKMRGLFSLLFGAGLALFMEKSAQSGANRWLPARRLGWLLVFGLIHHFLIWRGDILTLYALLGFVALGFLHMPPVKQLVIGLMGYVLGALAFGLWLGAPFVIESTAIGDTPEMAETRVDLLTAIVEASKDDVIETAIMTQGSYADFVRHNLTNHLTDPFTNALLFALETLPLMLIGMALYRLGLFNGGFDVRKQQMWGWIGIVGGALLTLAIALGVKATGFTYWGTMAGVMAFSVLPCLFMILGLAAVLAVWGAHAGGWLGQRLCAAGRMAFSNYLGTSILMMLVFYPWAGGLWGELTRPELFLFVLLGWAVMLAWSKPWLERFHYGPLEWLWRCLTYWRLFPLRRFAN